jgi:hypothetical protein
MGRRGDRPYSLFTGHETLTRAPQSVGAPFVFRSAGFQPASKESAAKMAALRGIESRLI